MGEGLDEQLFIALYGQLLVSWQISMEILFLFFQWKIFSYDTLTRFDFFFVSGLSSFIKLNTNAVISNDQSGKWEMSMKAH